GELSLKSLISVGAEKLLGDDIAVGRGKHDDLAVHMGRHRATDLQLGPATHSHGARDDRANVPAHREPTSRRSTRPSDGGVRAMPPTARRDVAKLAALTPKRGVLSGGPIHQREPSNTCTSSPTVQIA